MKWKFDPENIVLQRGQPVVFEVTSSDVHHGFNLPEFGVRADALPGVTSKVSLVPDKAGTFTFHCDYFCGSGHEDMEGSIVVQ